MAFLQGIGNALGRNRAGELDLKSWDNPDNKQARSASNAAHAIQQANSIARELATQKGEIAKGAVRHLNDAIISAAEEIGETDWSFVSAFGDHVARQLGDNKDRVWDALLENDLLKEYKKKRHNSFGGGKQDCLCSPRDRVWRWIFENPFEAKTLVACITTPLLIMSVPPICLGFLAFGAGGIIAGGTAASIQSLMGVMVATGHVFAVLLSAAASGIVLLIVKAHAAASIMGPTCAPAVASFLAALEEECKCV